jgi:hypothetical protein
MSAVGIGSPPNSAETTKLVFNGINGATGGYLLPPLTAQQVARIAKGEPLDSNHLQELKWYYARATQATLGPKEGVDPKKLAESGWGVIFAYGADPRIKEALGELLAHRRSLAGNRYHEYVDDLAYRPNESKSDFLTRHGIGPGPADPDRVPYYLLIVGDPETIPYKFQYQLDVQYAVGRIWFDRLEEYARYARSVVTAEKGAPLPRRATFVGVRNPDDTATGLSADQLVVPLGEHVAKDQPTWTVRTLLGDEAKKTNFAKALGGDETPALLFSASHGMGFPNGDPRQFPDQGALLCQDWPGPANWNKAIPKDFYLAADDVGDDARLLGTIAFHFACFGAGTPRREDFAHQAFRQQQAIAPRAFIASLPCRLLSHPGGGALAVIGHVEQAWGYSFMWEQAGSQLEVFRSTLKRLMEGHPVGSAIEFFNERYGELSTTLSSELEDIKFGKRSDDLALAGMWTANNDARGYAIVGDPAVRLNVGDGANASHERPRIEVITAPPSWGEPLPDVSQPAATPTGSESGSPTALTAGIGSQAPGPTVSPTKSGSTPPPAAGAPYASYGAQVSVDIAAAAASAAAAGVAAAFATMPARQPVPGQLPPGAQSFFLGIGHGGDRDHGEDSASSGLRQSLNGLLDQLGKILNDAVADAAVLEVSTYVATDMGTVAKEKGIPSGDGVRLRALTRIELDGDVVLCVPEENGEVDTSLWAIHADMVARAQAGRAELIRAIASLVGGLVDTVKPW